MKTEAHTYCPAYSEKDFDQIIKYSSHITFNSLAQLDRFLPQIKHSGKNISVGLRINPEFSEAYNNMGLSLSKTGKHSQAIKYYTKALSIKPDYIEAHNNMGTSFYYLGKIDAAVVQLQKALHLDPQNKNIRFNLDKLLKIKKRKDDES